LQINSIQNFNESPHIYTTDTLFQISIEAVLPILTIDKGSLKLPVEIASDIQRKSERQRYIWGEYGYLCGYYYFFYFAYSNQAYYDIWDTSSTSLLCRNIMSSPEDPKGLPFDLGGKLIYAWPKFVQNNRIYCVLDFEQAGIIYPQYDENDNPLILEILL
jgi:hypothetical protein